MATSTTANAAIATIVRDSEIQHQITHGGETTQVQTDGGLVDSFAKTIKDLKDAGSAAIGPALGQAADEAIAEMNERVDEVTERVDNVATQIESDYGSLSNAVGAAATSASDAAEERAGSEVARVGAEAALSGAVAAGENVGSFKTKLTADAKLAAGGIPLDKSVTITADGTNNGVWVNRAGVLEHESTDTLPAVASRNFQLEADGEWVMKLQNKVSELVALLALGVDRSGQTYLRMRADAEFDSAPLLNRLVPSGAGALMEILAGILSVPKGLYLGSSAKLGFFQNEDYWFAGVDGAGNVGDMAYGRDGQLHPDALKRITGRLNPDDLSPAFLARLQSQTSYVAVLTGVSPNRKLYVDDAKGTRRLITDTGDPSSPEIIPSGHVFWVDSAGVRMYAPCTGGTPYPVLPERAGVSYGDSLTRSEGTDWPGALGTALGIPWVNNGIGGQASSDIALRQGGLVPTVAITGGSIPASGAVALTITPVAAWRSGSGTGSFSFTGTIAGIPGTLTHDYGTNVWTFTRTSAGSVTAVADGTKFLITTPTYDTRVQTLFCGYNNQYSTGTRYDAERDYALMVANIKTYVKWFLVFGLVNSANEPNGSAGMSDVLTINARLATTYGVRYFDYRSWLINDCLAAIGMTPTAQDVIDKANGIVPTSLRLPGDPVHLIPSAYAAIASKVASIFTSLGYF